MRGGVERSTFLTLPIIFLVIIIKNEYYLFVVGLVGLGGGLPLVS